MPFYRSHSRYVVCLIVCAWMILGTGCRFPWAIQPKTLNPSLSPTAVKAYQAATAAFQDGEYDVSANRFAELREHTADKRLARLALYGLALSRLVAAETPEAYGQALSLWQNWVDIAPESIEQEDAALFDILIKEKMLFSNIPTVSEKTDSSVPEGVVPHWLFVRTKQEMDRLREKLETSEATVKKQQAKIQSLEKEIDRLKRQFKALEDIDQKIQEKKNAIPSTD